MCNLRIVCFSELQHLNVFDKSSESTDSFLIGFNHTQKNGSLTHILSKLSLCIYRIISLLSWLSQSEEIHLYKKKNPAYGRH